MDICLKGGPSLIKNLKVSLPAFSSLFVCALVMPVFSVFRKQSVITFAQCTNNMLSLLTLNVVIEIYEATNKPPDKTNKVLISTVNTIDTRLYVNHICISKMLHTNKSYE